jgi:hypothetical protein
LTPSPTTYAKAPVFEEGFVAQKKSFLSFFVQKTTKKTWCLRALVATTFAKATVVDKKSLSRNLETSFFDLANDDLPQ